MKPGSPVGRGSPLVNEPIPANTDSTWLKGLGSWPGFGNCGRSVGSPAEGRNGDTGRPGIEIAGMPVEGSLAVGNPTFGSGKTDIWKAWDPKGRESSSGECDDGKRDAWKGNLRETWNPKGGKS